VISSLTVIATLTATRGQTTLPLVTRTFLHCAVALPERVRRHFGLGLPLSLRVKRLGVNMKIHLGGSGVNLNDTLSDLRWTGSWKANVFERLVRGSRLTFVDIGANIGQTLLENFATHPDITCVGFEPIFTCASYLASVIQANKWESATILALALAAEEGVIALYRHMGSVTDSCTTVRGDLRLKGTFDIDRVPCLRFDTVRDKLNLNDIDLIKIDVEGGELEVVKGMENTLNSIRP
jgi:FkbM family methyltransferase